MTTGFNPAWAVLMLIIVIAAIPLSIWLMRRLPNWRTAGNGSLEIRESMSLGPREKVLVLRRPAPVGRSDRTIHPVADRIDGLPHRRRPACGLCQPTEGSGRWPIVL